jgi:hypothetical protein
LAFQQVKFSSPGYSLGSATDVQLAVNLPVIPLDRFQTERQFLGNSLIRQAISEQAQHIQFSRG